MQSVHGSDLNIGKVLTGRIKAEKFERYLDELMIEDELSKTDNTMRLK